MQPSTRLAGIYLPLITPFAADGSIAADALAGLAHRALDAGATGLVALGTAAEVATLKATEHTEVIEVCARVCRERSATLVVGAGGGDTLASVAALDALRSWPAITAALVTVPAFTRPGEAGVRAHFAHLAAHSPLPLVIYHIPYRTGQSLGATSLRVLGALPGIIGVKYAVGGIDTQTVDLLGDLPDEFAVLAGDDPFVSPLLALGASGGILASAHLATGDFVALVDAWQRGDVATARRLGAGLARLSAAPFSEPNPTVIKGVLYATGQIPTPEVRLPLLAAAPESVSAALDRLADVAHQTRSQ